MIPYQSDIGTKILLKMKEINPQLKIIYIGEYGGCCADNNFLRCAKSNQMSILLTPIENSKIGQEFRIIFTY